MGRLANLAGAMMVAATGAAAQETGDNIKITPEQATQVACIGAVVQGVTGLSEPVTGNFYRDTEQLLLPGGSAPVAVSFMAAVVNAPSLMGYAGVDVTWGRYLTPFNTRVEMGYPERRPVGLTGTVDPDTVTSLSVGVIPKKWGTGQSVTVEFDTGTQSAVVIEDTVGKKSKALTDGVTACLGMNAGRMQDRASKNPGFGMQP